jgi:beta-lactam-binding protein with PASTA domain
MKLRADTLKGLLVHFTFVALLFLLVSFTLFYKVLPEITNNGKVVSVPDVRGMSIEDMRKAFAEHDLGFEVTDSIFELDASPGVVLRQFPKGNSKVKINRRIQITVSARHAPMVAFPDLTGTTLESAQRQLTQLDLRIGNLTYKPDIAHNTVLETFSNHKKLIAGKLVAKGSTIDITIGSQTSKPFAMPDLINMNFRDAEFVLLGLRLKLVNMNDEPSCQGDSVLVAKTSPKAGEMVKELDEVKAWLMK